MKFEEWHAQFMDTFTIDSITLLLDDPLVCGADKWFIAKTLETTGDELDTDQREELCRIETRRRNSQKQNVRELQKRAIKCPARGRVRHYQRR